MNVDAFVNVLKEKEHVLICINRNKDHVFLSCIHKGTVKKMKRHKKTKQKQ